MTSETASLTDPWIEKHEAEFAYCYDKGNKLMQAVGANAYPTAILIDAAGVIQYIGSPGGINDSLVEKHLAGAVGKPLWEWPKETKKVKKAVLKNELGKALSEATKLGEPFAEYRIVVQGMIDSKLSSLEADSEAGDWLSVDKAGKSLMKAFSGLPQKEKVEEILDALKKDKSAQAVLAGQKKVAKIFDVDRIKRKDIPKMQKQLEAIAKKHPGTAADRDAKAGLKKLAELKRK